jgi:ATP-binding cassette subfamily B multidrug efflux pump
VVLWKYCALLIQGVNDHERYIVFLHSAMESQQPRKRIFDFSVLSRVFTFVAPYRRRFYLSILLAIVLAIIAPLRPYLIEITVNDYIQHDKIRMLILITEWQVGLIIVETLLRFYFTFLTSWLGQSVVKDLRVAIFEKILRLNLSQFDTTPIGTLTTRTINDIETINDIFAEGLIPIVADMLSIVAVLVSMFWMNWRLTFVCLIPFPILLVATYYFKESVNKSFIRVRNAVAALNAFVQEHITGMQVVQAFAAEDREFGRFKRINKEHRNANIKSIFAYSIFFPVVEIILALSLGLLVWYGAHQALDPLFPDKQRLAGQIVAFILMLNLLFRPLRVIADKFNVLQMGMIASERVFKVLDNPDTIKVEGAYAPGVIKGKIQFDHVWFAYVDEQYVLKDIDFTVTPGQTVAIVGHTGSGKTSIISLLNRLYSIQKGVIRVDDVAIEDYNLDALRSRIGIVLQDVFLFSGSILENVTLRNPDISREQVISAAKLIGVHEFIMQLPGNYDYNVMERGSTLSLGQRQLLSFLRALLYDPSILILDEATSSVDTESESLIQKAIDTLIAGRTSIVIAHRLFTIRKADKIIVLDKGVVREIGSHEELLEKNGYYARLYQMQFQKENASI